MNRRVSQEEGKVMSNSIHRITRALFYLWMPVCVYLAGPAMASSNYDEQMATIKTNIAGKKQEIQSAEKRKTKAEDDYKKATRAEIETKKILHNRKETMELALKRMEAFKTWNKFVTMAGGGHSLIGKLNPGSAGAAAVNFLADRALEIGGNPPMKANMTRLKNALTGNSPALSKLKKVMNYKRAHVFKRLKDEGQIPEDAYFEDYVSGKHDAMLLTAINRYIRIAIKEVIKEIDEMLAEKPWEMVQEEFKKLYKNEEKQIKDLKAEIAKIGE